ncbi:unnamed protein product [Nyctereutes procyonoides]|uniref:Small ribosomal subunit protein uS9 n=1 Tax=Nyctereutes procyonoides TaxID=34880 RepID=A0A811ZM31_NYCPR|nr:unnamed protein product [Nyctereutes procyonoides]
MVHCEKGNSLNEVNRQPLKMMEPHTHCLGGLLSPCEEWWSHAQIYAVCQSISKVLVDRYQKYMDEGCLGGSAKEIKDLFIQYNQTLLVASPPHCKSKKFGGPGAQARYHKSYQ